MKLQRLLPAAFAALIAGSPAAMAAAPEPPAWVVNPAAPGENLPAAGRSLFDRLFAVPGPGGAEYDLPFPFEALLARLDAQLQGDRASPLPPAKRVLIPLGRSLQRTAAAPEFFAYPRVVVGADSPPATPSALFLKDRLYIGYQERSAVLEVISYNETLGRFEFQLVKDYRAGTRPQVFYANRTLCYACHQNGAPVFSRGAWDETNANPAVSAQLAASGRPFHGIAPGRGVDVPYAIDAATKRANGFALTQMLWREGCGGADPVALRCRAGLFAAALRHALSGGRRRGPDPDFRTASESPLRTAAGRRWPGGLAMGNPEIPNRNPLGESGEWPPDPARRLARADVAAAFDPLVPRPPGEIWRADAGDAVDRLVAGLAEFVAATDRQRLEAILASRPAPPLRQRVPCRFAAAGSRWSARCQPAAGEAGPQLAAILEGGRGGGQLERLTLPGGGTLSNLPLAVAPAAAGGTAVRIPASRPAPRGADGNPLARLTFERTAGDPAAGSVVVELRQEFAAVDAALASLATGADGPALLGPTAFPRERLFAALFERLGAAAVPACCRAAEALPPPRLEAPAAVPGEIPGQGQEPAVAAFYPYCAACHLSAETFPPNFLRGSPDEVAAKLRHCGPRLYVRLAMADLEPARRSKTPMPPEALLPAFGTDARGWSRHPVRAGLLATVGRWLQTESGQAPQLDRLLAGGYEALPPCLPEREAR